MTRCAGLRRAIGGTTRPAFAALLVLVTATLGCGTVEPWERGAFASPRMQSAPHAPNDELTDHVRQSREATAAGANASGAGCGCY